MSATENITSKNFRMLAEKEIRKTVGDAFSEAIFKSAMEKAKRHIRNKYGSMDFRAELDENGVENVANFYAETCAVPDGGATWNRANAQERRRYGI